MTGINGNNKKAFTLVELLVVISIIALLLAILMPSLQKAREQAKNIVCRSNLHSTGLAYAVYAQDYNGKLPASQFAYTAGETETLSGVSNNIWGGYAAGGGYLARYTGLLVGDLPGVFGSWGGNYLPDADSLFCPSDKVVRASREKGIGFGTGDGKPNSSDNHTFISYWQIYMTNDARYDQYFGKTSNQRGIDFRDKDTCKGQVVLLYDQGLWHDPIIYAGLHAVYPFFHKNGWNVVHLDGSANFVNRRILDNNVVRNERDFYPLLDRSR